MCNWDAHPLTHVCSQLAAQLSYRDPSTRRERISFSLGLSMDFCGFYFFVEIIKIVLIGITHSSVCVQKAIRLPASLPIFSVTVKYFRVLSMSLFRINKKRVLSYSRNKSLYLKNSRDVYIEKSFFLSIKIFIIKSMIINLLKLSELLKINTAMLNSIL